MPPLPWSTCGHAQAAQSPMANTSSSRLVCSVGFTTSWLVRLVSSPAMFFRKSGALTPAAHTTSSAGSSRPSASFTPLGSTSATLASVCTSTPSLVSSDSVACDSLCGSAGSTRGAASITLTRMSLSASTRSSPKATISRVVRCSSAANSTPVAPAPMIATFNCSGRSGVACAWARMQALMTRVRKRCASAAVSSFIACSATPGVPKSLLRLPIDTTSVS